MQKKYNAQILEKIINRAHYLTNQMVFQANIRKDKEKGDPKIGGHSASSSSSIHIMAALHLVVKTGFDHISNKPHASPADHSCNYLMDLFLNNDFERLSSDQANKAMMGLRAYSKNNKTVFQSYHSASDPDSHNFLPSGSVGIPPVNAGYLALAYRLAEKHGCEVPQKAHFWSVIGDSEFREGSLLEAIPDFAERELGNLTWIIDYNRQSLDGHRITNQKALSGNDHNRIENTLKANGWDVIQVLHGQLRKKLFTKTGGKDFKKFLTDEISDYELQTLILIPNGKELKQYLKVKFRHLIPFLKNITDEELYSGLRNLGGHDLQSLVEALEKSKENHRRPCLIVAHTIKGWGLEAAAEGGNHSYIPTKEEMLKLQEKQNIQELFEGFKLDSPEGAFLKTRGEELYKDILKQEEIKNKNREKFLKELEGFESAEPSLDINLKMVSYPHTQWMLGQLTAKLTRIAHTDEKKLQTGQKRLSPNEKIFKRPAEMLISMAPDVGTSTNLNHAMDGKVFGTEVTGDIEVKVNVKNKKQPDLLPSETKDNRFIRFEIAEANVMSCIGSFGKMRDLLGIPILPLMTVYDFFIKRALDQYFYNLYWQSSFILFGTPSGITLSPEGAQHCWKSDIQMPNQITWEPFYCQELDWIFCESMKRHFLNNNQNRSGVLIRGVTRGTDQKQMIKLLRRHKKYKKEKSNKLFAVEFSVAGAVNESEVQAIKDQDILEDLKNQVLSGGYYLIDYRGYGNYEPGDNVVHIFSMGSLTTEAIKASEKLLKKGIYANVIVITSPDLLLGNLAHENNYSYLKEGLQINADLFLQADSAYDGKEASTFSGRRIPIVSVHDGEPGLLDNLGSIVGVKQETLAVRKHSKCGRPSDVYNYHKIHDDSIVQACGKVLSETALEKITIHNSNYIGTSRSSEKWKDLWNS